MNQARVWCVVKPTVGLPLFLGTVLIISLIVHASIMSNTTWFPAFFQGGASSGMAAAPVVSTESVAVASQ